MRVIVGIFLALFCLLNFSEAKEIDAETAVEIGKEAYIYGYPLVSMEMARRVMTNVTEPEEVKAPMGQFAHLRNHPKASLKPLSGAETDILHSHAWIDVTHEPYILYLPEVKGRYYQLSFLSGWTNVFAALGSRTTTAAFAQYALTGPRWKGKLPKGVKEIQSPTGLVSIVGKIFCTGEPHDYNKVHLLQDLCFLKPLSRYQHPYTPARGDVDPAIGKTSVSEQVQAMDVETYFNLLASLLKNNPPASADRKMIKQMARIGVIPGQPFSLAQLSPPIASALQPVPQEAKEKMKIARVGTIVNGWVVLDQAGRFGREYLKRAAMARIGLEATLPQDTLYTYTTVDREGKQLKGENHYILHFPKGQMPPVNSFWSLSVYNRLHHLTPNRLKRHSLTQDEFFKYNYDGSLDLYVQHESPGPNKESNWLPTPRDDFVLVFRYYWPKDEILEGKWKPPQVVLDTF